MNPTLRKLDVLLVQLEGLPDRAPVMLPAELARLLLLAFRRGLTNAQRAELERMLERAESELT